MSKLNSSRASSKFVPATGVSFLLPIYDPLSRYFTRFPLLQEKILGLLDLRNGQTVVDLACGTGTLLAECHRQTENLRAFGIDIDRRVLQRAAEKSPHSRLIHGSIESVPLADEAADSVLCSMAFHHLVNAQKAQVLSEALRICKPNRCMFLIDYAAARNAWANLKFLPVRVLDGWAQTKSNISGQLPEMLSVAGWSEVEERLCLETPLGTIRGYQARKP